ncbi:alpha/beta hydrolase fold protein [Chthoniobacter flavus Ellin428]|uniref:Alpha/beta hydrolase fold protein n=1 Tax=Chthoniobacter flavus Ellin428 TaxID=497964 RepID=B4CW55_9BACT|nr:alpha/beta fold hydrolase [Chthoniobacter flavus]EDY21647.1 alpha/beta hydrolase fold protein [Chthoniobacter flavus Ellin428]TCO95585.1 pimeloyl-ACP methyl ester carboxylesterase [Chthoniobacter flavus]
MDSKKLQLKPKHAWRVGISAGIVTAILVALKYALRPPTRRRVPDAISAPVFSTKVRHTSLGQVVYHESGSGRPLVFVHNVGFGASSYEWSKVYPEFASRHRVIALDLLGFGESERPALRLTAADCVRTLADFLRSFEWEQPPVLVASGWSAGLCVYLATQHPELVSRLVLHMPNGTGEIGGHTLSFFSRWLYRIPLLARFLYRNHLSTKSSVANWLRKAVFTDPSAVTEEMIDVISTCAQQPAAEHATLAWLSGSLSFDLDARLRMLLRPMALLWSEIRSPEPEGSALQVQRLVPACPLTMIAHGGIMAALEAPEAVVAALDEQLRADLRVLKAS